MEKSKVYLLILYILLFILSVMFVLSLVFIMNTQHEIKKDHDYLGTNILVHTRTLNRQIFNTHDLLAYDDSGKSERELVEEKT